MAEDKVTFAAIVIVAIVAIVGILGLTGFGAFPQLSGFSTTGTGTATVNISDMVGLFLIDTNISFGNGTVTQGASSGIIDSCGSTAVNGSWATLSDFFVVQNDGNVLANVTTKISNVDFVGGTAAISNVSYNYTNNETGSCLLDGGGPGVFVDYNASNTDYLTCQKLNFTDATDEIKVCLKLIIPSDAPTGTKSATVTFTASKSA